MGGIGDVAEEYRGRGWSVVPVHSVGPRGCNCGRRDCHSPGKHPRVAWSQAAEEPADVLQIEAWWKQWPDANVGVVTGSVSGIVVVDVDPRNGGDRSLLDLVAEYGDLPRTLTSRTGGGGRHLWFAAPPWPLPSVELAPGVELKAEGGMVVAPPSIHASGETYRWVDESIAPVELPDWVSHLVHHPAPDQRSGQDQAPIRTTREQDEFAEAWLRVGLEVEPGDNYYLCPFHDDHHPSLHIDAGGCRWYCFGCHAGGGIGALKRRLGDERVTVPRGRLRGSLDGSVPITLPGDGEVEVVGESFHQDEILELTGGRRRYGGVDVEAVAEIVPVEGDGYEVRIHDRTVGYLSATDAERLEPFIEEILAEAGTATCPALIRGGWDRGGGDVGWFGVVLHFGEASD